MLGNSFSNSVIYMVERQDERQSYHRSSVISCCDGAEPLLACSVPEKCDNSVQGTDLRYTFLKENKKTISHILTHHI